MSSGDLHDDLAALAGLSLSDLRKCWMEVSDEPLPKVRSTLLCLALAYEMQAASCRSRLSALHHSLWHDETQVCRQQSQQSVPLQVRRTI